MEAVVKKAFRKLSMEWHTDKAGIAWKEKMRSSGKFATEKELEVAHSAALTTPEFLAFKNTYEEKFKQISNANDILSDPQKRAAYNRFGHQAAAGGGGTQHRPGSGSQQRRYEPPPKPMRQQVEEGIKAARAKGGAPDLSRAIRQMGYSDFTNMNLDGCIFSKADRPTTIYRFESTGSSLKGAIFDGADIGINVNFRNARNVEGMSFVGARFIGELPFGPIIRGMNFTGVDFVHPRVTQQFENCKFNNAAFMQRTSFTTAKFTDCEFKGTDLSKLTFDQRPQFMGCKFDGAKIHHSLLEHIPLDQRTNIKLNIVDRFNHVHHVEFGIDGLDVRGKFGAKPSAAREEPRVKPKVTEAPRERRGAFQWFDDWREERASRKANERHFRDAFDESTRKFDEAMHEFDESMRKTDREFASAMHDLEPHKSNSKMGLMIAGAVVLLGGLVAAVSMGEEKTTKNRKHAQRFPMPQPTADWQTRVNQPMPQPGASLL